MGKRGPGWFFAIRSWSRSCWDENKTGKFDPILHTVLAIGFSLSYLVEWKWREWIDDARVEFWRKCDLSFIELKLLPLLTPSTAVTPSWAGTGGFDPSRSPWSMPSATKNVCLRWNVLRLSKIWDKKDASIQPKYLTFLFAMQWDKW